MQTFIQLAALRQQIQTWQQQRQRIALVPTMGNLHAGHLSLIALARAQADRVVCSLYVNPTQFAGHEGFAQYPRTPDHDVAQLAAAGCHAVWLPDDATMYPLGLSQATTIHVQGIGDALEGEYRPGHFDGVCTAVARLFHQIQPDVAIFGEKDYQQLCVLRQMVTDLALPIAILSAPTIREPDGLAMSSRNQFLPPPLRIVARQIYTTLQFMRDAFAAKQPEAAIEQTAQHRLAAAGFVVDYVVIRTMNLHIPTPACGEPRIALIAAKLGETRLIDNVIMNR